MPICIKPITDEAAPAVVVKFSSAIGVSKGTLNETPINVSDNIAVKAIDNSKPVSFLNA